MDNLPKTIKSALLVSCLAVTLIPQLAIATHSSVFYDMNTPYASSAELKVSYPNTLATTANSTLGVSNGLTGNYLGPFGATSLSWLGMDNQAGKVDISFDLVLRGFWASNTFSLAFSSQGTDYFGNYQTSPVDNLLSIAFTLPGNTTLPVGVTKLYEDTSGTLESAYHINTTTQAIYGYPFPSRSSSWSLVFTGSPTTFGTPYDGTWGVDNLNIRWGAAASVPEPGSALFLIAALPLIAGTVYRRRRQAGS
jgi:hypothetical protein